MTDTQTRKCLVHDNHSVPAKEVADTPEKIRAFQKRQNNKVTSYWTEGTAHRVPGYRTLEQRASEWLAAVSCCSLPPAQLHEVASYVPLAGARLMVTCRGGLPDLFRFERWLRSLAQHNFLQDNSLLEWRNIYEQAMLALWATLPKHAPDLRVHRYAKMVALAVEAGADADLLFAALQMLMATKSVSSFARDLLEGFEVEGPDDERPDDTNHLYAAYGPHGKDSAVSVLLRIGFDANERTDRPMSFGYINTSPRLLRESASPLQRAVRWARSPAFGMLLRHDAFGDLRGASFGPLGDNYTTYVRSSLWLALLLTTRKKADHDKSVDALKVLLQHRLCPHDVAYRCRVGRDDIDDRSLPCLDEGNDLLFRVFVHCEPRCCCDMCVRAIARGGFRQSVPKNTFKSFLRILDDVVGRHDHEHYVSASEFDYCG